jgi:hypothetical protein
MKNKKINITKASGTTAPFSDKKLMQSSQRAGASVVVLKLKKMECH